MNDNILVIGGGIVGISTAYFLARSGVAVTVIDKGDIGAGSSYGNAGMLCPCHSTPIAAPGVLTQGMKWLLDAESPFYIKPRLDRDLLAWLWQFRSFCNQAAFDTAVPLLRDLQRASLDLYRELIALENVACNFEQQGGLALYRTHEGLAHGRQEVEHLQQFGLRMSVLDTAAARALEPTIHPDIVGAVYFEEDAILTPDLFVQGLAQAARTYGAQILPHTELLDFEMSGRRIVAANTTRGRKPVAAVVLAAGAWSAAVANALQISLPLQPAKGYSITIKRPDSSPQRYLYLGEARVAITPMGDQLRFAGTLELAGFDFSINQRRVKAILRAADTFLADVGDKEVLEIWRGMRPCSPDGLPYIGRAARYNNLLVGTGHATLGMSMGPITGKLLAELVREERPSLSLHPFRIERFG